MSKSDLLNEPFKGKSKDELMSLYNASLKDCFGSFNRKLSPKRVSEINFYHNKYNGIDDVAERIKVMEADFLSGGRYVKFCRNYDSSYLDINKLVKPFSEEKRAWFSIPYFKFNDLVYYNDGSDGGNFISSIGFYSKVLPMISFHPSLILTGGSFSDLNEYLEMKLSHEWSHYNVMKDLCRDEKEFRDLPYNYVAAFDELIAELSELSLFPKERRRGVFEVIVYYNAGFLPVLSKEIPVLDNPEGLAKELMSGLSHAVRSSDWKGMVDFLNNDYSNWQYEWKEKFRPLFNHLGLSF